MVAETVTSRHNVLSFVLNIIMIALGFFAVTTAAPHYGISFFGVVVGLIGVGFVWSGLTGLTYRLRVSTKGVRIRNLWTNRLIAWESVSEVGIQSNLSWGYVVAIKEESKNR